MAARIKSPSNQKRLTNVAVVRLKRGGKTFELACYPNKVTSWREGVESDLDEVLQQRIIFGNVSKGVQAKQADIEKRLRRKHSRQNTISFFISFQKVNCKSQKKNELIKLVCFYFIYIFYLNKQKKIFFIDFFFFFLEQFFRDVATIVASRCVDSESKKPLTVGIVERALKEIQFQPVLSQPAKKQALEAIKQLSKVMPIERSRMKVRILLPSKDSKTHKTKLEQYLAAIEDQESTSSQLIINAVIEPGNLRFISEYLETETRGAGSLAIMSLTAIEENESDDESLMGK